MLTTLTFSKFKEFTNRRNNNFSAEESRTFVNLSKMNGMKVILPSELENERKRRAQNAMFLLA